MKPNKPKAPVQTVNSRINQQIEAFERRYGSEALDLACHGAFPLTLTTELLYCLREQFELGGDWYGPADVLLSGLCRSVGYDLYEMDGALRNVLLRRLKNKYSEGRLQQLEAYMVAYIRHRLSNEENQRASVLGDPERMHWTALACLNSQEAIETIQRELRRVAEGSVRPEERFRLAALVESYGDLLAEAGYRPVLLDWAEKVAEDEPIDESAAAVAGMAAAMAAEGFPVLKTLEFEMAEVMLGEKAPALPIEQLGKFRYQTPTVDGEGNLLRQDELEAQYFVEPLGKEGLHLEMVAIPGGSFLMGSADGDSQAYSDERPQHEVTVQPFFMGQSLVTQAQWRAVVAMPQIERELKVDPSNFKGDELPVERVSWLEAVEFCARLSQQSGREYRLPTEAEWEYACRAGTQTPFAFGDSLNWIPTERQGAVINELQRKQLANFSYSKTTDVDLFPKNAFGLSDMHGNVWEWCLDDWHNNYQNAPKDGSAWLDRDASASKVRRGGSWDLDPRNCRSACRYNFARVDRDFFLGFRVMCEAPRTS